MIYKRRLGHSQNQCSPRALQLPSFEAKSTQSKASWHCQRASQEHCVCGYYFECIQLFLRCHWTLLSLAFGALTLKQIDSVLKKAWILFRALNEGNWSWNRLENLWFSTVESIVSSGFFKFMFPGKWLMLSRGFEDYVCKSISFKSYLVGCCVSDS